MALVYPGVLPVGALVRVTAVARAAPAPIWLSAVPGDLTLTAAGRAVAWRARGGGPEAQAVAANRDGTRFDGASLAFEAEVNGGFLLSEAVPDLTCVSFGLVFQPGPGDARTLLLLQAPGVAGYLFLDHQGGAVRLAQKGGDLRLSAKVAGEGPVLVLCSLSQGEARLRVGRADPVSGPVDPATLSSPADLYIGCRGARAGLRNKLGSFRLSDVMIWPGQGDPDRDAATALWTERLRDGI